jgi:hypothetical protein
VKLIINKKAIFLLIHISPKCAVTKDGKYIKKNETHIPIIMGANRALELAM